jgi:CubicO group peptidase (beta-lactamase class C family)
MGTMGMSRRRMLAMLIAGTGVVSAAGATAAAGRPRLRRLGELALAPEIDAAIQRALALDLAPAISVSVYSRDGSYARAFGMSDILTRERVSDDTAFFIASATKSITAIAFANLHARGQLSLDANLATISPTAPLPPATRPTEVRLRDLLSHLGGILNPAINHRLVANGQHDAETLWRLLAVSEPNPSAPLGRFQYQNIGYNIATILSDRRLGVPWQELLRREVFEPAGMARASASMSRAKASGWSIAKPHRLGGSGARERSYLEKTDQTMHSAGGVVMSAQDAVRWLELLIADGSVNGRRAISEEAVQATRAPLASVGVEFDGYRREHYGLGWYIGPYRNERLLHHFGGFSGARAHISYLPGQAIGVAAFTNDSTVGLPTVNAIANYVYDRAAGYNDASQRLESALATASERYRDSAREASADRASRANLRLALSRPVTAYSGVYENGDWGRIEIIAEPPGLRVVEGVLRALAEPIGRADAVWVALEPGEGSLLQFAGDGTAPAELRYEGRRYRRVPEAP